MTFNYDPTIPNPPDDPADDVDQMQTNSASIAGIIAVDHVGFNLAGGGEHEQITFSGNNIPAIGGGGTYTHAYLFTNKQNPVPGINLDQLYFYPNGATAAQSSGQYLSSGSGSTMLMGGIILKWGHFGATANNGTISFTSAFPNNCFAVTITTDSITSADKLGVQNLTTANFQLKVSPSANVASGYYIAIGN